MILVMKVHVETQGRNRGVSAGAGSRRIASTLSHTPATPRTMSFAGDEKSTPLVTSNGGAPLTRAAMPARFVSFFIRLADLNLALCT